MIAPDSGALFVHRPVGPAAKRKRGGLAPTLAESGSRVSARPTTDARDPGPAPLEPETPEAGEKSAPDLMACLARVRRHDQAAARELIAQLHPIVLRTVRRHLPRRYAVEDMMQEVYLKVFTHLDQYRNIAPFTHWVAKIALRTCFTHLRTQQSRPDLRFGDLNLSAGEMVEAADADPSQRRRSEAFADRELLGLLLARLNAEDRKVIELFHLEQKSIAEISDLTGWNMEFAKMRVFRARRKLQRALTQLPRWDLAGLRRSTKRTTGTPRSAKFSTEMDAALEPRAA